MKDFLKTCLVLLCHFLAFWFHQGKAQNLRFDIDSKFKTFPGFNGTKVTAILPLANGQLLVAGKFDVYKRTGRRYLVRLNADGSMDNGFNINRGPDSIVNALTMQPDGKILVGGEFFNYNGVAKSRIARIDQNGVIDNSFATGTGFTGRVTAIAYDATISKIYVGGSFDRYGATWVNDIVRLAPDGSLDVSFSSGDGTNDAIRNIVIRPDGKLFIGGFFATYNNVTRNGIALLNSNGTLDASFNPSPGVGTSNINAIALQANGNLLIVGEFSSFSGTNIKGIASILPNGTLDNTFNFGGSGADSYVFDVKVQPDNKILVAGVNTYNGQSCKSLARLNADGTLDNTFTGNSNFMLSGGNISTLTVLTTGTIFMGGSFFSNQGVQVIGVAKLDNVGNMDMNFKSAVSFNTLGSFNLYEKINTIKEQKDGKLIVGGSFTTVDGLAKNYLVRLHPDGSLDNSFNTGIGPNNEVRAIVIQSDGKIVIGGDFNNYNGVVKKNIARLNKDGSLDATYNTALGGGVELSNVNLLLIQPDGKVIMGASMIGGFNCCGITRLNLDGSIDNTYFSRIGNINNGINSMAFLDNGRVIVGGYFDKFGNVTSNKIVVLDQSGNIDPTFSIGTGFNGDISSITVQKDGRILLSGSFSSYNGVARSKLIRLYQNGSVDLSFNANSVPLFGAIAMMPLSDKTVLVGGSFNLGGRKYIALLNEDGTLNTSNFLYGADGAVNSLLTLNNGKLLAAGVFNKLEGFNANKIVVFSGDSIGRNFISGKVFTDQNMDCKKNGAEKLLQNVMIKAVPGDYYSFTDENGLYKMAVDTGNASYTVSPVFDPRYQKLLLNQCALSHTVVLSGAGKDTSSFDFADSIRTCDLLSATIQSSRRRRCFRGSTVVYYTNYGKSTVSNVEVKVMLPEYILPIASVPAWSNVKGRELTYTIGALSAGVTGVIRITDSVQCGNEAIRGLTQCVKAYITPISNCEPVNPSWDLSSVGVNGLCISGESVFDIYNKGFGDMTDSAQYRIFQNDTVIYSAKFKLHSNDTLIVRYPSSGNTLRLEADQRPGHPGLSQPRFTIEGCGGINLAASQKGFVNSYPQDDNDFEIGIACQTIVDSFDPNEKYASPSGWGTSHNIRSTDKLDFVVHFQNTGSDTAITVTVVDTLDGNFDLSSLMVGTSSHPYTWSLSGKGRPVISFLFTDINLPDSTTNLAASNGFVQYSLKPLSSIAEGTTLSNKACIYFDYNSPVITNTTVHTILNSSPQKLLAQPIPPFVKFDQVISATSPITKKYGDKVFSPQAISNKGKVPDYTSTNTNVIAIQNDSAVVKEVGTSTLTATFTGDQHFNPSSVQQVINVEKADLTIEVQNDTIPFNSNIPTFLLLYKGFVNNENSSVLDVVPTASTTAFKGSPVGDYPIILTGGTDNHYNIFITNGILKIEVVNSNSDQEYNKIISVHPNPVEEAFIVSGVAQATITLYSKLGSLVLQKKLGQEEEVILQNLPSGMYHYEIIGEDGRISKGNILKK